MQKFLTLLLLFAPALSAEPWFVNRFDEQCAHCHVNPNGGGIRTEHETSDRKVDGGGDVRYLMSRWIRHAEGNTQKTWRTFLMTVDLGMRYRPFHEKLNLVYEARFLGIPEDRVFDNTFRTATTRSFYALVDDLPFDSFIQAGIYRPLFGNASPDHQLLAQKITSYALQGNTRAQTLRFRAVSVGVSPHIPFIKLHWIRKNANFENDESEGWAFNMGANVETLGASVDYSFWQHKNQGGGQNQDVKLQSLHGGFFLDPVLLGYEILSTRRDDRNFELRKGEVQSIEAFLRFWRKLYGTVNYANANATSALEAGKARQWRLGVRGFIGTNFDLGLFYEQLRERTSLQETDDRFVVSQLHFFF
ncbi:MAG: hypothetical protein HYW48_01915 [Deltaproteobacteria bacterium]|nr:hypothetical protein [Deltaproteobacteria bacterium]